MNIVKQSAHKSFQITQVTESIGICEALAGEPLSQRNGTKTFPTFSVYLGYHQDKVLAYIT